MPNAKKCCNRTREGLARLPRGLLFMSQHDHRPAEPEVAFEASQLKRGNFTGIGVYFTAVVLRRHLIFAQSWVNKPDVRLHISTPADLSSQYQSLTEHLQRDPQLSSKSCCMWGFYALKS